MAAEKSCVGYVDSVYCGSGVDGRGLRCVVFFSGCNLRCPFCHNPETLYKQGTATGIDELMARLLRYKPYFRRGGVTLSGGEPFLQKQFVLALAERLKAEGVHVCIETNGHICDGELIAAGDLIVDIKNQQSGDLSAYEKFLAECVCAGAKVEFTNVLVPGVNDREEALRALGSLVRKYYQNGKIRFLPFRKLCAEKYENLGLPFAYANVREAEEEDVKRAEKLVKL